MLAKAQQFPALQSKHSKGATRLIRFFGVTMAIVVLLFAIGILTRAGDLAKIGIGISISLSIIAVLLIVFISWLLLAQLKRKPQKGVMHIVVDKNGLHHYRNEDLIKMISYNDLTTAPQNDPYDVFFYSPPGSEASPDLCIYICNEQSKMPVRNAIFLDSDTVITNGNQLLSHFIAGIVVFRPDLRLEPGVLALYKM